MAENLRPGSRPILRTDKNEVILMAKVAIVYESKYGNTRLVAEASGEGVR